MEKTLIHELEEAHKFISEKADAVLMMGLAVIKVSHQMGKALEEWKASIPEGKTVDQAAEADFSPDLQAWLHDYLTIAQIPLAEPINETKPRLIQDAMRILQIIPTTIVEKAA